MDLGPVLEIPFPVTAQKGQGWDGGSPEGCGSLEKVTGQTWGIREGFLEEEEM